MLSRRRFVSWLSSLSAALGIGVRPRMGMGVASDGFGAGRSTTLDPATIARLAEVVLPSELGEAGFAQAGREFTRWIGGYREGVELVHPYGSADLRNTPPSPIGRWQSQLAALDREARQQHQRGFTALSIPQRRDLVTAAIADERVNRMPEPLAANHVALAVLAWYFASPDAVDRCYQSQINRNQCRPLVNAARRPLPLASPARRGDVGRGRDS
jgi:hypothetical protein